MSPGPAGVPRADIVTLIREGHSDREIGRRLHTNPKRVGRIRSELGIPKAARGTTITREQAWAAFVQPVTGGHMRWTGSVREKTCPVLKHAGTDYTARRIAFEIGHGRTPVGRVLPGCDYPGCVAPQHTTDQPMRAQLDAQVAAIFGDIAA
jgi:hypothetical protein